MNRTMRSLSILLAAVCMAAGNIAFGAAEADIFVAYDEGYSSAQGGDENAQVAIANAVAGSNWHNDISGTGARLRVCGYHKTIGQADRSSLGGYVNWMNNYGDGELDDVTSAADAAGADLVAFICSASGDTSAAVAYQPGRYGAYQPAYFLGKYIAHESAGHNYGLAHEVGRASPTTIMLHNYCGGATDYYSNPNTWLNGVNLLGDGGCLGSVLQGGDAAYNISAAAQGVADRYERVVYGSYRGAITYRWQFTNSPAAAPAGTTVLDEVSGALATVRGTNAVFTGTGLRLPGGTTGNTAADSIAAYIDLPNGMFATMTNFTIEVWATPLSAPNFMRVIEIGRTTEDGDGGGEWTCTPGSPAPGSTSGSDVIGLSATRDTGTLNAQRLIAGTNGNWQVADTALSTIEGEMHHYAITFEDSASGGMVSWYRDGAFIDSLDVTFHSSDIEDVNNWLGRSLWSDNSMAHMEYHDVRIQSVALNAGQVEANYRIGPNDQVVTLWANDGWGDSGFISGAWEFGQTTPDANHDYEVGKLRLLAPWTTTDSTFPGRSLSITGGQLYLAAMDANTVTIDDLRLNGATIRSFGDSGATQTLAGQIDVQNGTENIMLGDWGEMVVSADIAGTGSLLYTANAVTLTGNNTAFTGKTSIGDGRFGTLRISSEENLGTNPTIFTADQLSLNRGILETTQTMTIDDANRGIRIGPSGGFLDASPGTTLTIDVPISSPAAGNTLQTTPMDSNPIQGILFVGGGGTVELTNPNNSHNADMQVTAGELKLTGNGRINNGDHWMPFLVNGTFTDNSANDQILSGALSGNGAIVKDGASTLTLSGPSIFSGSTTVSNGTLLLNGSSFSSIGTITVVGGTLAGTGTAGGSLTVQSGGTLSPGTSIGTLTVNGSATLQTGGTTTMEINASTDFHDQLDVTGALTFGGTLHVVNLGGTPVYGNSYKLFNAGFFLGSFSSYDLPALDAGLQWVTTSKHPGYLFVDRSTPSAPPAPTGVNVFTLTDTQLRLEWGPTINAAGYTVKRSDTSDGQYAIIASGITDTSFIDSGLSAGANYYYKISAVNAIGESPDSSTAPGTTFPTVGDDAAFAVAEWNFDQNLSLAGTALSANPATDVTGNGNTMYGYDPTYGTFYSSLGDTPSGSGLSMDANGGQDAYTTAAAINNWSPQTWTIEASVVMDALGTWETFIGKDGTSHGVPDSDFYLQKTDSSINVGDVRVNLATVSGQRVDLHTGYFPTVGQWFHMVVTSDGSTLSIYVNDGAGWSLKGSAALTGGSAANNALGNGGGNNWTFMRGWYNTGGNNFVNQVDGRIDNIRFSQGARTPVTFLYDHLTMPGTPTSLDASAVSTNEIALSWSASTDAIGYYVKRSLSTGGPYTVVGETSGTNFNDPGLTTDTTYYYVVTAISSDIASDDSAEVSATPTANMIDPEEYQIADHAVEGGTNLLLTVPNTVVGHLYGMLATDSLTPPAWTNIIVEPGSGSNLQFTIPIDPASSNRYFMIDVQTQ